MNNDDYKELCRALLWAIPASLVIWAVLVLVFVTL